MDPREAARWWSERSSYRVILDDGAPSDARQYAPAAARNRGPILETLSRHLPGRGTILEVASGTGQHVVAFAAAHRNLTWQPSDPDPEARASIAAWVGAEGLDNVRAPLDLDVGRAGWDQAIGSAMQGIVAINLLHITPWSTTEELLAGARRLLEPGGFLYLYGPFRRAGRHTAESNALFDRSLRFRDPTWGVRDLEAVVDGAAAVGLKPDDVVALPANNLAVILRGARAAAAPS